MLIHQNSVISNDILEKHFVCNLKSCKGACCVEGDSGAPLEKEELLILDEIYEKVKPYLSKNAKETIETKGLYEVDSDGDFCTTTIENKECVFAIYDENEILKCGIEQAYLDNKIEFKKPISCHLYPIRITKTKQYDLLNYDKWQICSAACSLGESLKVPVYKFLKEPLIRKFGQNWFEELEEIVRLK
ncbi:MAG: DUF3109 family protein [Cytophagales bacterium]|nr:MAG: DUF3109 family protein [Cytophagales bacterium]